MNIGSEKRRLIFSLYKDGNSIQNLAIVTGLTTTTIESIVHMQEERAGVKTKAALRREWESAVKCLQRAKA